MVSRKQKGSGSSASATVTPVFSRRRTKWAAAMSIRSAISASAPAASGLKVPGTVLRLTVSPGAASPAISPASAVV